MALTYASLTTNLENLIRSYCENIDSYDEDAVEPKYYDDCSGTITDPAAGSSTSKVEWISGDYEYPPIVTGTKLNDIIHNEFLQPSINIDTTSTNTISIKQAIHFINAALTFLCYHIYIANTVTGYYKYYFFIENASLQSGAGLPLIKTGIQDADLMLETFSALSAMIPIGPTRLAGIDLNAGSYVETSSCSSSSCSSSSSCCSNSCSSSSMFIAYFNI